MTSDPTSRAELRRRLAATIGEEAAAVRRKCFHKTAVIAAAKLL